MAVVLPIGPVWLLATGRDASAYRAPADSLAAIAEQAGCELTEFRDGMDTNPPVNGEFVERIRARDGSYAGERPPSLPASIHALYHGRVLLQYRPGLSTDQLASLERLVGDEVLLFENQTSMPSPVAATAYLSLITCPRVDGRTLQALEAFRDRRRAFGQAF
ncbi:MAG: DUF3105 domain-containing protein [Thermoleophilaceae bacterium]